MRGLWVSVMHSCIVCGGAYSNADSPDGSSTQNVTNRCEMYDLVINAWRTITPPAGWTNMGDAPCSLLPDGRLLVGYYNGMKTALYDPVADRWTAGPTKGASASEETWTLLGDDTVLEVQRSNPPFAGKHLFGINLWVPAGKLPVDLVEAASLEIGPACLMPNGKVLFLAGPVDGLRDSYLKPTCAFEYGGTAIARVAEPDATTVDTVPYQGRMLRLPTGQVLVALKTDALYCYTPDGSPQGAWRPTITSVPSAIRSGLSYTLGTQLSRPASCRRRKVSRSSVGGFAIGWARVLGFSSTACPGSNPRTCVASSRSASRCRRRGNARRRHQPR